MNEQTGDHLSEANSPIHMEVGYPIYPFENVTIPKPIVITEENITVITIPINFHGISGSIFLEGNTAKDLDGMNLDFPLGSVYLDPPYQAEGTFTSIPLNIGVAFDVTTKMQVYQLHEHEICFILGGKEYTLPLVSDDVLTAAYVENELKNNNVYTIRGHDPSPDPQLHAITLLPCDPKRLATITAVIR